MKQVRVHARSTCPKQRKDSVWSRNLGGGQLLKISVIPKVSGDGMPITQVLASHSYLLL